VVGVCLLVLLAVSRHESADRQAQARPPSPASLTPGTLVSYLAIIEQHRPGETDEALAAIARWTRSDVERAAAGLPGRLAALGATSGRASVRRFAYMAVLLHTDAARAMAPAGTVAEAVAQLEIAESRLAITRQDPESDQFARTWYLLAGGFLTGATQLGGESLLERAVKRFPDSADLLLASGALQEVLAGEEVQRISPRSASQVDAAPRRTRGDRLNRAADFFRRALALDPTITEARVRLGHVLLEQGRADQARTELERAVAAAAGGEGANRFECYISQLFLGRLHQRGRSVEAWKCYEAALAIEPEAQTPRLALSQLLHAQGDRDGTARLLEPVAPADGSALEGPPDPWIEYRLGTGRLSLLRQELMAILERVEGGDPGAGRAGTATRR